MPFDVVVMVTLALAALVFAVGVSVLERVL